MKNGIVAITLFLFLTACNKQTVSPLLTKDYTTFKTTELIADNISEEITGNDEVHLLIMIVKNSPHHLLLIASWHDSAIFIKDENKLRYPFNYGKNFAELKKDSCRIIFILFEKDTDRPAESIVKMMIDVVKQNNYQNSDSLKTSLKNAILDDDLLDLKFYKASELSKNISGEIVFRGINIFDKYQYRLKYQWE